MPYFDLPDDVLVNLRGTELHFGSSIYPYRVANPVEWILDEAKALGLTELRFSIPREHVDHAPPRSNFDPHNYKNPDRVISEAIRRSGFDIILSLQGHPGDSKGKPVEWPRHSDGSINGEAAAPAFANFTRWIVNHTKDFVGTYELWNEAFGHIDDKKFKKSFGPGGSRENADNYSAMMLPALQEIRKHAPEAKVTIEGNFWNVDKSIGQSPGMQQLIRHADYLITHPYSYKPTMYATQTGEHKSQFVSPAARDSDTPASMKLPATINIDRI